MRLWIDLTDLAAWHGPFTGIQQTVFNLASRYAARADVGFMSYDEVFRRFSTIDFGQVRRRLDSPDTVTRGRLVTAAQQAFDRLPQPVRGLVSAQTSRRLRGLMEQALRLRPTTGGQVELGSDCTVLVPGAAWYHKTMLTDLCRLKRRAGFRLAGVIYDLVPVFCPQFYPDDFPRQFRDYLVTILSESSALFAISRATQGDVQRFCLQERLPVPDTRVFRLGDSLAPVKPVAPEPPPTPGEFILTVGLEWRKNAFLLYQMLKLAAEQGIAMPPLVIAGRPSWVKGDHQLIMRLLTGDPDLRDRVRILTESDDARLTWLYQNCRFTLFPSLREGWGLPVAESLRHGKVCLASSASSVPEVGGELVDYASPYDPRSFLDLVQRYLDPQRLGEREAAIRAGYRPHDWDAAFVAFDHLLSQALDG
jgi:glycosyltransferase involved in cell wall biosynthesis